MIKKYALSCLNPVFKTNPYTGKRFLARCNHCAACVNLRHEKYVHMMEDEGKCHRYAFFCTLTYDDKFVPKLYFSHDRKFLYNKRFGIVVPNLSLNVIQDRHWLDKKQYIEFPYYQDFQKFVKRLRQNFLRNVPKNELVVDHYNFKEIDGEFKKVPVYKTFRYFCASELGPSTIRPHFHSIFYFDSRWFAENFQQMFSQSWSLFDRVTRRRVSLGVRSQCRACSGDADRYTAAYCDSVTSVPQLFTQREIRPRHSYSRRPSLGCLSWNEESLCQKIHSGTPRDFNGLRKDGEPNVISVPQSIENKLFPKCPSFGELTPRERAICYSMFANVSQLNDGLCDYDSFQKFLYSHYLVYCHMLPNLSGYLHRQVKSNLEWNVSYVQRPFYQLYLTSKRFYENCNLYGFTSSTYLKIIVDYYSLRNYNQLVDWLGFLERESSNHDVSNYYSLYLGVPRKFIKNHPYYDSLSYKTLFGESSRLSRLRYKNKKERDYQLRGNAVVYEPEKYSCELLNCKLWQMYKNKCVK